MHALSISMLLLLHSAFMLSVVKMLLKGEVGGHAFNSHGNYIVDHGKSWKNHGIGFLNFCGNSGVNFPVCYSGEHFVNSSLKTNVLIETRQRKAWLQLSGKMSGNENFSRSGKNHGISF